MLLMMTTTTSIQAEAEDVSKIGRVLPDFRRSAAIPTRRVVKGQQATWKVYYVVHGRCKMSTSDSALIVPASMPFLSAVFVLF